ncbi:PLP-dependent aminotransferase [Calderihabitans maritimus]|uniref:PLP-dependent aminotransferase n=2 Tax=Calderihabitans maritimus TaxID=1246530 RepID=A0A1Z5HPX6_9FIRM|nr:PLP-dependent aminotransferase [Calderihabitans maritimus]
MKGGEGMANKYDLISLDEALNLDRKTVRAYYKDYVNPGLATLMSLLDFDKSFVKAEGVRVWDREGNEYLDFLGGYGALNLGHNHPAVVEALEKVKDRPNLLQASLGNLTAALAHNLARITPGKLQRSFFGNSGAEAVEGALKLARAATGKQKIIYAEGSFHGKTFGALSVTGRTKYQKDFRPLLPGCSAVPFGDLEALERALSPGDVAAVILEPIQGEGGIIVPPPGYLSAVRELCSRYEALLVLDEIQTGFGRTGYLFAAEEEGVVPDIMCVAKSLGGGVMPIGAYITTEEIWDRAYGGMEKSTLHTSTFGGNTRACAAAIAAINALLEENLTQNAREQGRYLLDRLVDLKEKHPVIKDVRGRGLLVGLEFEELNQGLLNRMTGGALGRLSQEYMGALVAVELMNRHRIITAYTLNNPNVIRLEPPLTVTREEIDRVVEALDEILSRNRNFWGMALSGTKTVIRTIFKR